MTLTWNGKQIDWVNVAWFGAIHAGALLAPWTFTWTGLALALRHQAISDFPLCNKSFNLSYCGFDL